MKRVVTLFLAATLVLGAAGCKASSGLNDFVQPQNTTTSQTTEPELTGIHAGHKSGHRFQKTIMLEGMDEIVMAEHFVSSNGYYMDYFYEDFVLEESPGVDSFLWRSYDGSSILGYLCISVTPGLQAEDQAELISLRMDAEAEKTIFAGYEALTVYGILGDSYVCHYIFDTPRGCVEIEMACIIEGLEGIGARMYAMLVTFEMFS